MYVLVLPILYVAHSMRMFIVIFPILSPFFPTLLNRSSTVLGITHILLFSVAFIDRCLYICPEVFDSTRPVPHFYC